MKSKTFLHLIYDIKYVCKYGHDFFKLLSLLKKASCQQVAKTTEVVQDI